MKQDTPGSIAILYLGPFCSGACLHRVWDNRLTASFEGDARERLVLICFALFSQDSRPGKGFVRKAYEKAIQSGVHPRPYGL